MNHSTPGLPVHHQLLESTQTHVHRVSDAIQPPHPLSSPSPPALNLSQNQGLFIRFKSRKYLWKLINGQRKISGKIHGICNRFLEGMAFMKLELGIIKRRITLRGNRIRWKDSKLWSGKIVRNENEIAALSRWYCSQWYKGYITLSQTSKKKKKQNNRKWHDGYLTESLENQHVDNYYVWRRN